ncbi:MAG: GTP-binding protein [Lachnospiraceae bacterium]|nr:GTP-binding protein [Lachnospiraceae bacterium]MEE3460622.1 GTP-binding protein [Lachnospiraceae bacterium]
MNGLLKFITCGSVDDGKSTLIGHLLYDAKLIFADQEKALELDSKVGSNGGKIDYSLLLDGLMAEREQGITIDVAYRYFTTDNRSFICADTPGHEEYTRNMAVGASFADLAIILTDASQGVLIQTKRHARICALMGINYFVFAVNKMDLVSYDEGRFNEIKAQIEDLSKELGLKNVVIIPVSATEGDNITKPTENFDWYKGPVLLDYLENVDVQEATEGEKGFYMPVQRVCRPDHTFRGFEGQAEHGVIRKGDLITTLPSREKAHVKSLIVADREVDSAEEGQPLTIQLDREVDISRGSVIERESGLKASDTFESEILWMDDEPLKPGTGFLVKVGTAKIPGTIKDIRYKIDVNTGEHQDASTLNKNEIAYVDIKVNEPVIVDEFEDHRTMGELILIDRVSHMTSACGVVRKVNESAAKDHPAADRGTRSALNWQIPYIIAFDPETDNTDPDTIEEAEFRLTRNGRHTYFYHPKTGAPVSEVVANLNNAGIIVLLVLDKGLTPDPLLTGNDLYKTWSEISGNAGSDRVSAADISSKIFQITNANLTIDSNNWII